MSIQNNLPIRSMAREEAISLAWHKKLFMASTILIDSWGQSNEEGSTEPNGAIVPIFENEIKVWNPATSAYVTAAFGQEPFPTSFTEPQWAYSPFLWQHLFDIFKKPIRVIRASHGATEIESWSGQLNNRATHETTTTTALGLSVGDIVQVNSVKFEVTDNTGTNLGLFRLEAGTFSNTDDIYNESGNLNLGTIASDPVTDNRPDYVLKQDYYFASGQGPAHFSHFSQGEANTYTKFRVYGQLLKRLYEDMDKNGMTNADTRIICVGSYSMDFDIEQWKAVDYLRNSPWQHFLREYDRRIVYVSAHGFQATRDTNEPTDPLDDSGDLQRVHYSLEFIQALPTIIENALTQGREGTNLSSLRGMSPYGNMAGSPIVEYLIRTDPDPGTPGAGPGRHIEALDSTPYTIDHDEMRGTIWRVQSDDFARRVILPSLDTVAGTGTVAANFIRGPFSATFVIETNDLAKGFTVQADDRPLRLDPAGYIEATEYTFYRAGIVRVMWDGARWAIEDLTHAGFSYTGGNAELSALLTNGTGSKKKLARVSGLVTWGASVAIGGTKLVTIPTSDFEIAGEAVANDLPVLCSKDAKVSAVTLTGGTLTEITFERLDTDTPKFSFELLPTELLK